ncbi:hypothetical protein QE152_g35798 [Popillia japonica]|uniref:Secreted protein n=1 Tax=Popillia japonica TaxID=7064 RepID=A0AAW1IF18_POPJA
MYLVKKIVFFVAHTRKNCVTAVVKCTELELVAILLETNNDTSFPVKYSNLIIGNTFAVYSDLSGTLHCPVVQFLWRQCTEIRWNTRRYPAASK